MLAAHKLAAAVHARRSTQQSNLEQTSESMHDGEHRAETHHVGNFPHCSKGIYATRRKI